MKRTATPVYAAFVGAAVLLAAGLLQGCKGNPEAAKRAKAAMVPTMQLDTTIQAFYTNKCFIPNIVRINHKCGHAFIYVDSPANCPKNNRLPATDREAFYQSAAAAVPAADIAAYNTIWDLPEVQKLQNADGGYGTVFTTIATRPVKDTPLYVVEVRRNNVQEYPLHTTIAYVKMDVKTHQTWIADNSGYFVPISALRAIK